MTKHGHTLNVNQINNQVAKINHKHLATHIKSSQISVQSVIKEALHFKSELAGTQKDLTSSKAHDKLSTHLQNHIHEHYKNFNSFAKRNRELVIVLEYYKLINNCISLEAGMVASGNLIKRQKIANSIRHKLHRTPKHLPKVVYHRKHVYDHMSLLPSNINKHCGIHDGKHMNKFIYNLIGSGRLNYRAKKQLNKISINDRLYVFKFTGKKQGIIQIASNKDVAKVVDQLISFLHSVYALNNNYAHR